MPVEAREVLGFQGAGGEVRAFEVGVGLGRREGIFFVVVRLLGAVQVQTQTQTPMQTQMHMGGGSGSGSGYRGDTMFGGQQQGLGPQQGHPQMGYQPARTAYGGGQGQVMVQGQQGLGQGQQGMGQSQQGFAPMQSSQGQGQTQGQAQGQYAPPPSSRSTEQRALLLPPIRMREGEGSGSSGPPQGGGRRRSSRVDIGGLIEGPEGR